MTEQPQDADLTRADVARSDYSIRKYLPWGGGGYPFYSRYLGRLENPAEIERYIGRWEQTAVVRNMLREVTPLAGICNQWVDAINKVDLAIKPGDPNSDLSVTMAEDARRFVRNLDDLPLVSEKFLQSRTYGYYPAEKVFGICSVTGLLGPVHLFDIPPWHISFDNDFNAYYGSSAGSGGAPIEPRKLIVARWGSKFTPYGESVVFPDCHASAWRIKVLTRLGLQAAEILNRAIPWVKYPESWEDDKVDDLEQQMIQKYKYCVMVPCTGMDVEVDFPTQNVMASGGAGRSEFDRVADEVRYMYIRILGTPQTQNEQNASRGLETVRKSISDDKTPPGAQMRDRWLTRGILDDLGMLNWPSQPRQLWPVFESDTSDVTNAGITGPQAMQLISVLSMLTVQQMTPTAALEAICAIGLPRPKAILMVQSTVDERGSLKAPSQVLAFPPQQQDNSSNGEDKAA